MKVGFIGLGSQGAPIARRIIDSGEHEVVLWARRAESLAPFGATTARFAESPADLAAGLDALGLCVFGAADLEEVLFGPNGAAPALPSGAVVLCHSTVAPQEIVELAARARGFGVAVVDAPVSGGEPKASIGELLVMAGGDAETLARAMPVLRTYSNDVVHLGAVGTASQAKLLNNAVLAANLAVVADAFDIGAELGVDRNALAAVLRQGTARSFAADLYAGFDGLAALAATTLKPTLTKDVGLLAVLVGGDGGAALVSAARELIDKIDLLS
ncbi:MAG TPA: NAD(P)-dependent oxidoreductase [Jatrophihabitans sp.]